MKKQTKVEFVEKSKNIFGDSYYYDKVEYINSKTDVTLVCKIHGEFIVKPGPHISYERGCLICKGVRYNVDSFIAKAKEIHGDKYIYDSVSFENVKKKVNIICKIHGSFYQMPDKHINSKQGCPKCTKGGMKDLKYFIEEGNKIHNYVYDYSKALYYTMCEKVEIICPKHGSFWQSPCNHLYNKTKCYWCSLEESRLQQEEFIKRANKKHNNRYDYTKTKYTISSDKIEIICLKHGSFFQNASSHLTGNNCPKCVNHISIKETKWLDYLNIPKECRNVAIKIGKKRYNVDAYTKENNTIYEFYGDYWHGNLKVYSYDMKNKHNKILFKELYNRTINREKELRNFGFKIITIWESNFNKLNIGE